MPTLQQIGFMYGTDKATAHHYLDFYEQELRGFNPSEILEIGVLDGASLRTWKLFYPDAFVCGIDIAAAKTIEGCTVYQADAIDVYHLESLFLNNSFSLIIDDGSHNTRDQQIAFQYLFNNKLAAGGFYIMEDVHTSFISSFVNSKFTTYELLKAKYDCREFWRDPSIKTDSGTIIIKKQ